MHSDYIFVWRYGFFAITKFNFLPVTHTGFFFSQLMRHWTQTHTLLFSPLTLYLIAALVQFHHVLMHEKTHFLILAGSAFYQITLRDIFGIMHFLIIWENIFFHVLKCYGLISFMEFILWLVITSQSVTRSEACMWLIGPRQKVSVMTDGPTNFGKSAPDPLKIGNFLSKTSFSYTEVKKKRNNIKLKYFN